jgi:biopolymer transport protein ExbB/TolQ
MNFLGLLENGLFALGQVLRLPVMLLLWGCVGLALYYTGRCLLEAIARQREHAGFDMNRWLQAGPVLDADEPRIVKLPLAPRALLRDAQREQASGSLRDGGLENLVAAHDERIRRALLGPRALVKIAPSLGLLGTLIPMGSSLAALASGNLEAMAGQMVVAFTTTIIGLGAGTLAYGVATARQSWVNEAIREQRYLAERIAIGMEAR